MPALRDGTGHTPKEPALRRDAPQIAATVPTAATVRVASSRETPGLKVVPIPHPDLLNSLSYWPRGRPRAGAGTDLLVDKATL